jgi:hypothetical protein
MFKASRNRQEVMTQLSETHRENLRRNLHRRIEAARASGDENLVRLLEAESNYIG